MSQSEIAQILAGLDELKTRIKSLEERLDVAQQWQSAADRKARDASIRREAYSRPLRFVFALVSSPAVQRLGPWLFAAAGIGWASR